MISNTDSENDDTKMVQDDNTLIIMTFDQFDKNSSNDSINFNKINAIENWRGRGRNEDIEPLFKEKRKRLTAYMEPVPKTEMILNKKSTRSQSNTLFLNGNTISCLRVSK